MNFNCPFISTRVEFKTQYFDLCICKNFHTAKGTSTCLGDCGIHPSPVVCIGGWSSHLSTLKLDKRSLCMVDSCLGYISFCTSLPTALAHHILYYWSGTVRIFPAAKKNCFTGSYIQLKQAICHAICLLHILTDTLIIYMTIKFLKVSEMLHWTMDRLWLAALVFARL